MCGLLHTSRPDSVPSPMQVIASVAKGRQLSPANPLVLQLLTRVGRLPPPAGASFLWARDGSQDSMSCSLVGQRLGRTAIRDFSTGQGSATNRNWKSEGGFTDPRKSRTCLPCNFLLLCPPFHTASTSNTSFANMLLRCWPVPSPRTGPVMVGLCSASA